MGDSDPRTIGNPHYWNHSIEILLKRTIENLILCTMGGRTNRGPGVIGKGQTNQLDEKQTNF